MKIILLTHKFYPAVGGTEANAEFLAQVFHEHGFIVHLITWTQQKGEKKFPYKVIRNPSLKELITEHIWADVVFENSPVLRLSWPSIFFGRPLIVVLNTWISNEDGTKSIAARTKYFWLKRAFRVIAVSKAIAKKCWAKAVVIDNAYNDDLFKRQTDWALRTKQFVFLGRLVSDKGADMAVEAIDRLNKICLAPVSTGDNLSLTIIGEGKDAEKLKTLVDEKRLNSIVSFEGNLSGQALVDILNEHKYILVPSRWEEPFGIVVLEGMASGCIPIVSDGGGLPDAVGTAGLIFKRGDINDMVGKLTKVLSNTELRSQLQSSASAHLFSHSKAAIGRQYIEIIETVVYKNQL